MRNQTMSKSLEKFEIFLSGKIQDVDDEQFIVDRTISFENGFEYLFKSVSLEASISIKTDFSLKPFVKQKMGP